MPAWAALLLLPWCSIQLHRRLELEV